MILFSLGGNSRYMMQCILM